MILILLLVALFEASGLVGASGSGVYIDTVKEQIVLLREFAMLHRASLETLDFIQMDLEEDEAGDVEALGHLYEPIQALVADAVTRFEADIELMGSFCDDEELFRAVTPAELVARAFEVDKIAQKLSVPLLQLNSTVGSSCSFREDVALVAFRWKRMAVHTRATLHRLLQNAHALQSEVQMAKAIVRATRSTTPAPTSTPYPDEFWLLETTSAPRKAKRKPKKFRKAVRAGTTTTRPETTALSTTVPIPGVPVSLPDEASDGAEWNPVVRGKTKALRRQPVPTTTRPPATSVTTTTTQPSTTAATRSITNVAPTSTTTRAPSTITTQPSTTTRAPSTNNTQASTTTRAASTTTTQPSSVVSATGESSPRRPGHQIRVPGPVVVQSAVARPIGRLCELSRAVGSMVTEMTAICESARRVAHTDPAAFAHMNYLAELLGGLYQRGAAFDAAAHLSLAAFPPYLLVPTSSPSRP